MAKVSVQVRAYPNVRAYQAPQQHNSMLQLAIGPKLWDHSEEGSPSPKRSGFDPSSLPSQVLTSKETPLSAMWQGPRANCKANGNRVKPENLVREEPWLRFKTIPLTWPIPNKLNQMVMNQTMYQEHPIGKNAQIHTTPTDLCGFLILWGSN